MLAAVLALLVGAGAPAIAVLTGGVASVAPLTLAVVIINLLHRG